MSTTLNVQRDAKGIPGKENSVNEVTGAHYFPWEHRGSRVCIHSDKGGKQDGARWVVKANFLRSLLPHKELDSVTTES